MNTSLGSKNTGLLTALQAHFKGDINGARVRLICLFITALCKLKAINYDRLASAFDVNIKKRSSYRRIQRFMAESDLPMKMISTLIFSLLPEKHDLALVLDRTNWKFGSKNINILMLGVSYKNVAFPLMFTMLDKRGNSSTPERIELLGKYMDWFGKETINCLLADREFIGDDWLKFLTDHGIAYHIRIRNNFKVYSYQRQDEIDASWLFNHLKMNELYHYPKIVRMHGQDCYLSGCKIINREGKREYLMVVSFNKLERALAYYRKRWQVESLFRALKTSGFNIEDTHVTDLKRLERLFLLTMIAFVWCYRIGDFIDENIEKIKNKKYGLDYLSRFLLNGFNSLELKIFDFLSCT